jgi:hypothetical protein
MRKLLQQALDVIIELYNDRGEICNANQLLFNEADKAIKALETELAKPEQEPVAWHHPDCAGVCLACLIELKVYEEYGQQGLDYLRKRVQTPRKPWQGLTDEDTANICMQGDINNWHDEQVIDATEAKLKEKNGAL